MQPSPFTSEPSSDLSGYVVAAQAGDEDAFAVLWRAFQPRVLRYLRLTVGDLAEDVASSTWADTARSLERFHGDADDFRAWLFTIARRRSVDALRARSRRPETTTLDLTTDPPSIELGPDQQVEDRWSTTAALEVLAILTPEAREIVALRVLAGLDVATVAKMVGKQPGAVRVATHRALRALASHVLDTAPSGAQDR